MKTYLIKGAWILGGVILGCYVNGYVAGNQYKTKAATSNAG